MSIAIRVKDYYEHDDFKENYAWALHENFGNDQDVIIDRIYDLFNVRNWDVEKHLKNFKKLDRDQCKKIYDLIYDDFETFTDDFRGYYVGSSSLDSISFGEQEEQLTGIYNHRTGKDYTLAYLKKNFEENDFYVNGEYAYYNLDGGLHIDLLNNPKKLDEFILTI